MTFYGRIRILPKRFESERIRILFRNTGCKLEKVLGQTRPLSPSQPLIRPDSLAIDSKCTHRPMLGDGESFFSIAGKLVVQCHCHNSFTAVGIGRQLQKKFTFLLTSVFFIFCKISLFWDNFWVWMFNWTPSIPPAPRTGWASPPCSWCWGTWGWSGWWCRGSSSSRPLSSAQGGGCYCTKYIFVKHVYTVPKVNTFM